MVDLKIDKDPAELGFDAGRLKRLETHFQPYVDDGRLPGWMIVVARHGHVAHLARYGMSDREAGRPVAEDTLWRMASMTKPITSVAAMMLYEEGAFELKDPISKWIPAFADMRVYTAGSSLRPDTRPATEPIRVWHLLTHTAGLTYGFHYAHPVDAMYRAAGFEWGNPPGADLAACCDLWAAQPLVFEPGSEWNYSVATDVLGRVVEVVSGRTLEEFFHERILGPLGMNDTGFWVPEQKAGRLAGAYMANPAGSGQACLAIDGSAALSRPVALLGGGGLIGTAADYLRFGEMMRRGGELDGVRLLSPRTVDYMSRNHLPGGADLEQFGRPLFAETTFDGVGFGLGLSVVTDPAAGKVMTSPGEYGWGGAFSTFFCVAPKENITVLFFTQLLPSSTYPIRSQLRQLVYQALVD
ncbi:MAG TPA: serine hydrolase domain-containing protein [Acidimicrobiales bacterium]|jgi:CubicO group peptidase (beta-lactamase class C family)|nr:serine hydrolase domain-containing protein [Acidimicrobiales bacterium]